MDTLAIICDMLQDAKLNNMMDYYIFTFWFALIIISCRKK